MAKVSKEELIKAIEAMSVLELNELVKALEEKFGISPVPVAFGSGTGPAAPATSPVSPQGTEAEEKTIFNVELTEAGANKIAVIKALREINNSLGLAEAKALVETTPKMVLENAKKEAAQEAQKKLEAAGAKVTLK